MVKRKKAKRRRGFESGAQEILTRGHWLKGSFLGATSEESKETTGGRVGNGQPQKRNWGREENEWGGGLKRKDRGGETRPNSKGVFRKKKPCGKQPTTRRVEKEEWKG